MSNNVRYIKTILKTPRNYHLTKGNIYHRSFFISSGSYDFHSKALQTNKKNRFDSWRTFSTHSSEPFNDNQKNPNKLTLRRLAAPFFQLCHPDKFANIASAQKVNLKAVQTLNELIDICDNSETKWNDLKREYIIEFMVPSHAGSKSYDDNKTMCTRREVVLNFRPFIRSKLTKTKKMEFHKKAHFEIRKLLRIAGCVPPKGSDDYENENENEDEFSQSSKDAIWNELNLESDYNRPKTKYERSREQYVRSINWKEREIRFERALQRAKENAMTYELTTENRKRQIIADVVSRIRFCDDDSILLNNENETITPLEQLIALRRISLLFMDHFDKLNIEMNGRIWDNMIIILSNDPNHNLSQRKKRLKKQSGESGFKFTLCGDKQPIAIVTVPIDFLDDEILHEFDRNLEHLHEIDDTDFVYW